MTTIRFNQTAYKFNHSKNPKGWGTWMFEAKGFEFTAPSMTFTQAKKWITKEIKSMFPNEAVVEVKVLP